MAQKKITDLTLRSDFDATCNIPVDDTVQTWRTTGQQVMDFVQATLPVPVVTIYSTAGSGTHTITGTPKYIRFRMIGGGAGGVGQGSDGTSATDSVFGGSTAPGGAHGAGAAGGLGGAAPTLASEAKGLGFPGADGDEAYGTRGGNGAQGFFGGRGPAGSGSAGPASCNGSGGGAAAAGTGGGGGGGAGAYIDAIIAGDDIAATYSYVVGAKGLGGSGTTTGGDGADGLIIVEEFYQ